MKRAAILAVMLTASSLLIAGNQQASAQGAAVSASSAVMTGSAVTTSFSGLTYDKAVEAALVNSQALRIKQLQEDKAQSQYDDVYDYKYSWSFSDIINQDSADTSLKWAQMQLAMQKEAVAQNVKTSMNNINELKSEIDLAKVQQSISSTKLAIALDKKDAGLISDYDFNNAKNQKDEADKNLEVKKLSLESAYLDFMKLTGLSREAVENPENRIVYVPLQETALTFITRQLGENPHIWYYEKQLSGAKLSVQLYEANTGNSYEVRSLDESLAGVNLQQLKKNITDNLNSKYNETMTIEKNYQSAQIAVTKATQTLDINNSKFAAGLCTQTDVDDAKLAYQQAQVALQKIVIQHIQDVDYLNKPYINPGYL